MQLRAMLSEDFAGRLLDFDGAAAEAFGRLHAAQRKRGKLPGTADAQIAAIALVYKFAVATRDASGFAHSGLKIFNPWTD